MTGVAYQTSRQQAADTLHQSKAPAYRSHCSQHAVAFVSPWDEALHLALAHGKRVNVGAVGLCISKHNGRVLRALEVAPAGLAGERAVR